MRDALALLKAQEPVEPILANGSRYILCGNCKYPLCKTSDDDIERENEKGQEAR
jgi:hypothetical protein